MLQKNVKQPLTTWSEKNCYCTIRKSKKDDQDALFKDCMPQGRSSQNVGHKNGTQNPSHGCRNVLMNGVLDHPYVR